MTATEEWRKARLRVRQKIRYLKRKMAAPGADIAGLQARIAKLEAEIAALRKAWIEAVAGAPVGPDARGIYRRTMWGGGA